ENYGWGHDTNEKEISLIAPLNPWPMDNPWLMNDNEISEGWNNEQRIDEFLELTPRTSSDKGYEEITDFYFDEKENPVVTYNTEDLPVEHKDRLISILDENSNLFAK
ncbi:2027_t:CDS:1, partial [Scutellospora calospora]